MQRHGPLVFGVCRRLLGQEQDAEDAFQATFLVLASKAGSIRRRGSLASFLHGVAERIARKARRTQARRRDRAMPLPEVASPEAIPDLFWRELRLVLDEEIRRLPEHYRQAFVLCCLEGHTNAEAAQQLGCPKGTVLSRLARARDRLARHLRRRDITLSATALTSLLTVETLRAAVPPSLANATMRFGTLLAAESALPAGIVSAQVFALTREGVQTMFWMKMTTALAIALTGTALTATVLAQRTPIPSSASPPQEIAKDAAQEEKPEPPKEEKKTDPALDEVLRKWAKADESVREMHVRFTKTATNKTFDEKIIMKGQASVKKPDLWRVDLRDKNGRMETVVLLEYRRLHFFDFKTKTEKTLSLPEASVPAREADGPSFSLGYPIPEISWKELETQFRWLTFGPLARDISPRFNVRLAKKDQWYVYLDITTRTRKDKKWFSRSRVVLDLKSYRLRQLWMEYPNGNEILVDYLSVNPDLQLPPITRESLLKGLPKDWKRIDLSADKQPAKPPSRP